MHSHGAPLMAQTGCRDGVYLPASHLLHEQLLPLYNVHLLLIGEVDGVDDTLPHVCAIVRGSTA